MKKKVLFYSAILIIGATLGVAFGYKFFTHRIANAGPNVVAYTDGTAEIIINDSAPDQIAHSYRAIVPAIWEELSQQFFPPTLTMRGGNWQRLVYSFNSKENQSCDNNIFFMDRINKKVKVSKIGYCIYQTLDFLTATKFLALNYANHELAVGHYENGIILARAKIPGNLMSNRVTPNWEATKFAFITGGCDAESTSTPKVFIWDYYLGEPVDKTPVDFAKTFACDAPQAINYDHDKDIFYLQKTNGGKITQL